MRLPALVVLVSSIASAGPCWLGKPECTERLPLAGGFVLIYRSHPLSSGVQKGVERAYIMVHGTNRNANEYFSWTVASTAVAGALENTVIIAPHFKARTREGRGDAVESGEWYWTNEGWKSGEAALNSPSGTLVFSYDVMDQILGALNDAARFPSLKEVVVAGHSAGGQYAQRYAAVNRMEPKMRLPVRYVVANPSSYVYLNELRARSGTPAFGQFWDADNCTTYNQYRYGLDKLSGYAAVTGAEQIRAQFPKRNVTYIVGELDTNINDSSLDKGCPAQAQGAQRNERGRNFHEYMKTQFGAQHKFAVAPGCGHSAVCVFAGPAGVEAVFGEK